MKKLMLVILIPLTLILVTSSAVVARSTGSTTQVVTPDDGPAYLLHYDAEKEETVTIPLVEGEPSTNPKYAGNYNNNNIKRRNVWQHAAPHISKGILRLWDQGWTGKGVTVYIQDTWYRYYRDQPSHGENMEAIIKGGILVQDGREFQVPGIAPEATIVRPQDHPDFTTIDIWNQSTEAATNYIKTDFNIDSNIAAGVHMRGTASSQDILISKAGGNSVVDTCESFGYCNQHAVGLTGDWDPDINEWTRDPFNTTIVAGVRGYGTPAGLLELDYIKVNKVPRCGGSSSAAAIISGAAALLKQKYPNLTAGQLKTLILETAIGWDDCSGVDKTVGCVDRTYGHGILNVRYALSPLGSFD